jgi:nitroreductase
VQLEGLFRGQKMIISDTIKIIQLEEALVVEFKDVITLRKTTRKYLPEQISESQLQAILIAAQTAPLATGDDKTTHLTVVQNPEIMERLRQCCQGISRKTNKPLDAFYGAPTVIFVSATDLSEDHIEYSNVACVIENMLLAATNEGLGSTYIWGCLDKLRQDSETLSLLSIPEGYEILSACAVGYPAKPLEPREPRERIAVTRI